jgi:flagellin-like protein
LLYRTHSKDAEKKGVHMRFSQSRRRSKKGMLGIETLIIFIAMILVSAVAAGVLLKTVGALQQRSLAVGNEARERLATGVEVTQVQINANVTLHQFNEMETIVRLQPGSYDLQLLSLSFSVNTYSYSYAARLMSRQHTNYRNQSMGFLDNNTWVSIGNFDLVPTDSGTDYAKLAYNLSGGDEEALLINLSYGGLITVNLSMDLETNGTLLISELPIKDVNASKYDMIYGFITISGAGNTTGAINEDVNFYIETDIDECDWDTMIPNYRFCYLTKIGDIDTIIESGELINLRYKLSTNSVITRDQNFDLSIAPKRGNVANLLIYVPEVFSRNIMILWP